MDIKQQITDLENLMNLYELGDDGYYISRQYKEHHRLLAKLKNELNNPPTHINKFGDK